MFIKKRFICTVFFFFFISCLHDMIVLKDIKPAENRPVKKEDDRSSQVTGMVVEIEEAAGEQKYIYIKLGSRNNGVKYGLKGFIFNDPAMTEKIGKFQFIEVYRDFSKGQIIELNYKVKPNAVVLVETDPDKLIN